MVEVGDMEADVNPWPHKTAPTVPAIKNVWDETEANDAALRRVNEEARKREVQERITAFNVADAARKALLAAQATVNIEAECKYHPADPRFNLNDPDCNPLIRKFETGADRDVDTDKLDFEGFLSPLVLERFAQYMHKNRTRRDGTTRDGDNWQCGMPAKSYMQSGWRHFHAWWTAHRKGEVDEEALCGLFFNVQGYLHEALKAKK